MSALYALHGLVLHSELVLPELVPAAGAPQVTIERGAVVPIRDTFVADPTGVTLAIAGVARFRIAGGRRIVVDAERAADAKAVRLFLLGSAMGAILHQRGLLPLHANMILVDGRAIGFAGPSGSGKSTLAAAFAAQGHPVLADDVAAVRFDAEGCPVVAAGQASARLWADAIAALGLAGAYPPVRDGVDKFTVPILAAGEGPLDRLYLLAPVGSVRRTLSRAEAAGALIANTYRGGFLAAMGLTEPHWRACVRLARAVPVYEVPRAAGFAALPAMIDRLIADGSSVRCPDVRG